MRSTEARNALYHVLTKVHADASANGSAGERVVFVRGPNDVTVAGYGHAVHFDGHAWKEDEVPLLNASYAGGPAGVCAFGANGGIVRRTAR